MKKTLLLFALLSCVATGFAQVKGKPVSFTTQDGWNIAAVYAAPEKGQKTALLLHDLGKSHRDFAAFTGRLAQRGIGYLALDLRGHGQSVNKGVYTAFAKEGVDNDFNKMVRDVNAAMDFLKGKGIAEEEVVFVGAGLGANVAAKAASLWPGVGGLALLTPVTNARDVLTIPALRVYKGQVFIAAAADDKKTFLEASVLRNVAFLTSGEGQVTFATAYDKKGHELLDAWTAPELVQWLQTPQKPEINPDIVETPAEDPSAVYEPVAPSDTEDALFPSVLQ